ncbi:MAG: Asp-tRNA(Asn)/Glu-tRNA(Gln) amidotransferase subunit GatC [Bacillota bacterium]|nr:Asp-tRNA(Asn)/Glu-tRNA(Gln) amidotransferase subunit GatC [Bacillota bacterium]
METNTMELKYASLDARIVLTEQEEKELTEQVQKFLDMAAPMKKINLANIKPTYYGFTRQNNLRKDEVKPSLPLETSLANAPDADDSCFHVPKIVED